MKKIYIAGKINGEPNFKAKFKAVEEELTKQGHAVLNPAELPSGLHYEDYMDICFAMLDVADTIYLLPDYKDSPGALRELERAKRKGKEIIYPNGALNISPMFYQQEIRFLRRTNSIYKNFIYKLCEGLLKEIEKDGYCRMIVSEEEVIKMMEKVKDVKQD